MSDSQFSQLENQIEILNAHLEKNNLDEFNASFIEFDQKVRSLFSNINSLSPESIRRCEVVFSDFNALLQRAEGQKKNLAKQIGVHISNQKKLNVYKSIK
ncbi:MULTISPECIES: hypothetical protein [unclassified Pseudoalteromonas]|uniref:hypothetical protein n=1 Tax=unclassified Pseudoalteromonas TaxID=194690 RepID=UPI0025B5CFDE|nr:MULTISPECIES: hypothetical protein [unclassified Pseudoalteromonas]MDN3378215.1 hypothetical protein [Pseudoalteromonas sp. APC 3893]MDN3388579.1 hypothetical protein [Pseudoalteromonas sp. APC 4017]